MNILKDENVGIAEKVALYDCKHWLAWSYNRESLAFEERMLGNVFYNHREYKMAIWKYNNALTLTKSSKKRGLAYANRAVAYLALKMYEDCLDSVSLAKDCVLPKNVLQKVLARERVALEHLGSAEVDVKEPTKLTYRRHKQISSFVHCLSLKDPHNLFGGIVTTKNLLPGDVLVVEKPLAVITSGMCNYCFRKCGSLKPCKCGSVMFCSEKCQVSAFTEYHDIECLLMPFLLCFERDDNLAQRILFKLLRRFKDVENLKNYLQNIENPNPFDTKDAEVWSEMESFESQFRIYYATKHASVANATVIKPLISEFDNILVQASFAKTAITIDLLKKLNVWTAKTDDDWRFLSELTFRLFCYMPLTFKTIQTNTIRYVLEAGEIQMETETSVKDAAVIHGTASLFKSECQENVCMDYVNGVLIVRAIKFIPIGDELLCSML